jgi:hypothetical protein
MVDARVMFGLCTGWRQVERGRKRTRKNRDEETALTGVRALAVSCLANGVLLHVSSRERNRTDRRCSRNHLAIEIEAVLSFRM